MSDRRVVVAIHGPRWPGRWSALVALALCGCAKGPSLDQVAAPPSKPAPAFPGRRPTMQEASARFSTMGVQPGQPLPRLEVVDLDGRPVDFAAAVGGRPAVVMTCSLTCNVARRQQAALAELRAQVGDDAFLALVYTIDAHPQGDPSPYSGDEWVPPANQQDGVLVRQPVTLEERLALARRYARDWAGGVPVFVDTMDDAAWRELGEAPNVGLLVDGRGMVVERTGWFDAAKLGAALARTR